MKKSTRNLVLYGGLAAAAYYFFMRKPAPAPAPAAAAPATVAGLGYFPSGADRPFARTYQGSPSAWWRTHNW